MGKPRIGHEKVNKIRALRSKGFSITEISTEITAAKSTVFRHVQGVEMPPDVVKTWLGKRGGSKKRRLLMEAKAYEEAKEIVKKVTDKELILYISALY